MRLRRLPELLQARLGLEIDADGALVTLHRPRLPPVPDWLKVSRLRAGDSRLDLLFRRQDPSVAVGLLAREGDAEVEVML